MESEIRIVQLDREALGENSSAPKNDALDGSTGTVFDENVKYYFATDYFDSMTVTKKFFDTPLADIMHLKSEGKGSGRETSVQSFALYFSQNMWKKYEEHEVVNTENKAYRGDPFEQEEDSLRYLSIIQVHITPEILRRMEYGTLELWDVNRIILEPFIDDLYTVIDDCRQDCVEDAFCYRVYQMLSTGDLAVVIKSRFPATSYRISSRIRERVAEGEKKNSKSVYWTLYKTYTILAIEYGAKLYMREDKEDKSEKFVIRGCYSCKYWGEVDAVRKMESTSEVESPIFGLNGRYDFSMDLTVEEFAKLYPTIQKYKGRQTAVPAAISPEDTDESFNVRYLKTLLEKQYLSYINERYLLKKLGEGMERECISQDIRLDGSDYKTLSQANDCYIDRLLERFEQVKFETIRLRDAHKNLEQYFNLMKRQIMSCRTINQVSDTRIYVPKIGKQLEIALDAIDVYRETIKEEKNLAMIDTMVEYIRNMVHMLDSYTEYIRNNNLQSLQTPNYNIESSMSMEKILIGYNEYFRHFIATYLETFRHENETEKKDREKQYLPVVIPDLHYMDISVKVLFSEGFSIKWQIEKEKREKKENNNYLMIVESPTLAELGDIPVFMALLFHEMAHQFRYIGRKERNETLLDLLVDRYVFVIASNMTEKICWDICTTEVWTELWRMLKNGLKDAVRSELKGYFDQKDNLEKWNAPLIYFRDEVTGLLGDLSKSWNEKIDIEEYTRYFIKCLQKDENLCNERQLKYLGKMRKLLNQGDENEIIQTDQERKEIYEKLLIYAFVIAGIAACDASGSNTIEEVAWIFEEREVENRIKIVERKVMNKRNGDLENDIQYEKLWEKLKESAGDIDRIERMKVAFDNLVRYYPAPTEESQRKNHFKCIEEILKAAYGRLCKEWREKEKEYADIVLGKSEGDKGKTAEIYRTWFLVGRYLGIDCEIEENCKKFTKILWDQSLVEVSKADLKQRVDVYREVTADMFMYTVMGMTPFTYLNLITSVIPTANLRGINLERIITVLYIMTSTNNEANEIMDDYYTAMESMWDDFIGYCKNVLCGSDVNEDEDFSMLVSALKEKGKDEYTAQRTNADFSELIGVVKDVAKKSIESDEKKKFALIHIKKICDLLQTMAGQEQHFIALLAEAKAVRDDYMFGKTKWDKIRKELANCHKYSKCSQYPECAKCSECLGGKDRSIQELLQLAKESTRHLQSEHYKVGIVKDKKLNEACIEFLLRSYYSQKIKDSRMGREE